jgi:hypothetical protein
VRARSKAVAVIASLAVLCTLGLVIGLSSIHGTLKLPSLGPVCTVNANGEVTLDPVQMVNAATITAVGVRRSMPERAVVIALATALQESKLENRTGGDRDSVGLFQQRPSQGWGPADKLKDPRYASSHFYTALKKVTGWQKMSITEAAQRVQRSAFPNAYEKWANESAVLARALLGQATAAVACTVSGKPVLRGTAAATALVQGLRLDWGASLDQIAAEQAAGLTVQVTDASAGWRYAHWLVSHANESGVERVQFANLEWHAPNGTWQPVAGDAAPDNQEVVAEVYR